MAGGIFNTSKGKVRPGTYVNIKSGKTAAAVDAIRGVSLLPLIGYDWGPQGEWIVVTADSPEAHYAEFGRSVYDSTNSAMLMLRLMLMNAETVYVYIPESSDGAKASKVITLGDSTVTVEAKYKGTLGNTIKLVSVANPTGGFDVTIYVNGTAAEKYEGVTTVGDLAGKSEYVTFTGASSIALVAFASQSLENGSDPTAANSGVTTFLDKAEKVRFNTMCFPVTDATLQAALKTKIKYIRESIGWKCQAVAPNFAGDYEGIINLVNSFVVDEVSLTTAEACAWLAGATAGADYVTSLTYAVVEGATSVVGEMTNEEAIAAIQAGKTFFSVDENGDVILEYDTNSLVTITDEKPEDMAKNRPLRVYDTFANELLTTFRPGKFDNDDDGWSIVEGLGRAILQRYLDDGAIMNVNLDEDFVVDTGKSTGDAMYITVGLQPVDSADKFYITVVAR